MKTILRLMWLPTLVGIVALWMVGPPPQVHAQISSQIGAIGSTGQQAVTGSPVALSALPTTVLCLKANPSNAITIYWSTLSTVSTTTGFPLAASETSCVPVSNANLIYVVASTTGARISFFNTTQ